MSFNVFFSKKLFIWFSKSSHKLWAMHFTDLPVHPFLDSFLQPTVLTFSSTALIMLDSFISSGRLVNKYPPKGPLELWTKLFFINFEKICSKNDYEIPCLKEISVKLVGWLALIFAKSAIAITAYLPFDVNFMPLNISFF